MSWRDKIVSGLAGASPGAAAAARAAEWETALAGNTLPSFVMARLAAASSGKAPWIATMSPAELVLARHKGVRPLAMVSGTCWLHYGYSWTNGHAEGWHAALARMREEAAMLGAHAVVDVRLRTTRLGTGGDSMDFTVLGTAVRIDGLAPSAEPIVATVPALEFMRLLTAGIVPVGIAIGAHYEWLTPVFRTVTASGMPFTNTPLTELGQFWEQVRRRALLALAHDAQLQGDGVLAHTHFGQLIRREVENNPPQFLGRHIVIGTVVQTGRAGASPLPPVQTVVDMRDAGAAAPARRVSAPGQDARTGPERPPMRVLGARERARGPVRGTYPVGEQEGAI